MGRKAARIIRTLLSDGELSLRHSDWSRAQGWTGSKAIKKGAAGAAPFGLSGKLLSLLENDQERWAHFIREVRVVDFDPQIITAGSLRVCLPIDLPFLAGG